MKLDIEGLALGYGGNLVVEDFDLHVGDGELMVLLGPSGCGKTSVLRSVAGLEVPQRGRISLGGDPVYDSARHIDVATNKRDIGLIFQSYAIWPHMTVLENVMYPLKVRRKLSRPQMRARAQELLDFVGLVGVSDRGASRLSGGQMQRVALARSLAMSPRLLLLDEPLSNLDAKLRDRLRFDLKEMLQQLEITALYVTHDLAEGLALADRMAVMQAGRIIQLGQPEELYKEPASDFVADFLGVTNLLPGRVDRAKAGHRDAVTVRLANGATIQAAGAPPAVERVVAAIRPEVIRLTTTKPSGPNVWDGTITVASYLGSQVRYKVRTTGNVSLDVVAGNTAEQHAVGTQVHVAVAPDDVRVLEDERSEEEELAEAAS